MERGGIEFTAATEFHRYYLGTLPTHRAVRDLKRRRWREEAEGSDPIRRRCAKFYLSQDGEGPVVPT
jgi:hypothetical protein